MTPAQSCETLAAVEFEEPTLIQDAGVVDDLANSTSTTTSTVVVTGHRRWVAWAAAVLVVGLGSWALLASSSGELESSPFWSDSAGGVRLVDVSGLVGESTAPALGASGYLVIDIESLPSGHQVRSEFLLAERQALVELPATYRQDIHAITAAGKHVFFELRGQSDGGLVDLSALVPASRVGWQEATIRGVPGLVSGGQAEWFEPGVGTVRVTSDEPAESVLEMIEALDFKHNDQVPVRNRRRARDYESTADAVLAAPDGGWSFDAAEVLVVSGVPGSTGRLPFSEATEAVAFVVVSGDAAAVAGVAPAAITSFRILTMAGGSTEIPTVVAPANSENVMFAFGLAPGLEAARVELIDRDGQVADSFRLPTVLYEQATASVTLE